MFNLSFIMAPENHSNDYLISWTSDKQTQAKENMESKVSFLNQTTHRDF